MAAFAPSERGGVRAVCSGVAVERKWRDKWVIADEWYGGLVGNLGVAGGGERPVEERGVI